MGKIARVGQIWRVVIVIVFLSAAALAAAQSVPSDSTQPAPDPIAVALTRASAQHQAAVDAAKRQLLSTIDREIKTATSAGDLAEVGSLQAARAAAATDGSIPDETTNPAVLAAKAEYDRVIITSRSRLTSLYLTAERAYTHANELGKAQAAQDQFDSLMDGDPTLCPPPIDLLKIVDPDRDALAGHWHIQNGFLTNDRSDGAQIRFPYRPPDEYNLHLVYDRQNARWGFELAICDSGKMLGCGMPNLKQSPTQGSLEGMRASATFDAPADAAAHCDLIVRVRTHRLTIIINGQKSFDQPVQASDFDQTPARLSGAERYGLGMIDWYGSTTITKAQVTEISGVGEVLDNHAAK